MALARRNQQPVPMADVEHRRDPEVQREGNDVTQAAFQSPTAQENATAGGPPTHPVQLSDGGGTDVGGAVSQQTQDTGTNSNAPPVNEEGNGWVAPAGWIANGAGGWTSPDGAHWGPREKPATEVGQRQGGPAAGPAEA
jgi:hypothetical protein